MTCMKKCAVAFALALMTSSPEQVTDFPPSSYQKKASFSHSTCSLNAPSSSKTGKMGENQTQLPNSIKITTWSEKSNLSSSNTSQHSISTRPRWETTPKQQKPIEFPPPSSKSQLSPSGRNRVISRREEEH